jgi:hypothetical protein
MSRPILRRLALAPFAALIYADATYSGARLLADAGQRAAISPIIPGWEAFAVAALLAVGSLLALTGLLKGDVRVERAGLPGLAVGLAVFACLAFAHGRAGAPGPYIDLAITTAAGLRWLVLGRSLRLRCEASGRAQ